MFARRLRRPRGPLAIFHMFFRTCPMIFVGALLACGPAPVVPRAEGPAAPLALGAGTPVGYVLGWSWDGARRDGDTYVFENDLGYTIGLDAAYLGTGRLELVPCEGRTTSLSGAVSSLFIGTAHAGHARAGDTSAVVAPVVESLHDPGTRLFGRGFAGEQSYCGVHMLGAPLTAEAADGRALARESLVLSGWWSAPGSPERHVLKASVNLQAGRVRPLAGWTDWPDALAHTGARVAVSITRHPTRAFDRIDLARLSDVEVAFEVLGNLLQGADVRVATRPSE